MSKNVRFLLIFLVILLGVVFLVYGVSQSENFYGKIKRPADLYDNPSVLQGREEFFDKPFLDTDAVSGAADLGLDGVPVVSEVLDDEMSLLGYEYILRVKNDSAVLSSRAEVELYFDNLNLLLMQEIKSLQPNGLVELIFFDNSFLPMKQGENTFQVRINVASLEDEIDYVNNFSIWKFFVSADGRPTGSVQAISN